MSFIGKLLGLDRGTRAPNFVVVKDGKTVQAHVPLAEEVQKVRVDYIQSVLALGQASARSRQTLASNTLVHVHGKTHI